MRAAALCCKLHFPHHSVCSGHQTCPIEDTFCTVEISCCTCWDAWSHTLEVCALQLIHMLRCTSKGRQAWVACSISIPLQTSCVLSSCTEKPSSIHLRLLYTRLNTMLCNLSNICVCLTKWLISKSTEAAGMQVMWPIQAIAVLQLQFLCTILCSPAQLVCQFWQDVLC